MNPDFDATLAHYGLPALSREETATLQINVGKRCNQACHHCHVDAGPARREMMTEPVAARIVELLDRSPSIHNVDITGGAPELNPNFAMLVAEARRLERAVIVRCNFTVLFENGMDWLAEFYARHRVRLVCSLPCYTAENVARQRGGGVFEKSIRALRLLNEVGFGRGGDLVLDLVYNPIGPSLPPPQAQLEREYRDRLGCEFGIAFDHLLTITNMPISRFARQLAEWGRADEYMSLLVNHFNPMTVSDLMCRTLISAGYDGRLYDCDFNQMLNLPLGGKPRTIWGIEDFHGMCGKGIATGAHCFGCAAGAGSSCGGALQ